MPTPEGTREHQFPPTPESVIERRVVPYSAAQNGMVNDRLDSWKEIAGYLKRGVRTVQRWERVSGLPVRRVASQRGAVYAFRAELDTWWRAQSPQSVAAVEQRAHSSPVS